MSAPTFAQVRLVEDLSSRLDVASKRKRRGLTIRPDEFGALMDALNVGAALMDEARLAALPPAEAR